MAASRKTRTDSTEAVTRGMHLCGRCSGRLVQPVRWFERPDRRWQVDLRCPECEWTSCGSFDQDEVDRFDEELDRASQVLMDDLRTLTRANLEGEVDRFAGALWADEILPEDF